MRTDCFPEAVDARRKSPVSDLAEINPRYPIQKDHEYPFVEMAAVGENFRGIIRIETRSMQGSGLARFKNGDTLFAKITPCPENGKVAIVDSLPSDLGLGSTEFIVLAPKPSCHPRYLYHLVCCHAVRGHAVSRMEGSTGRQRVPDDVFVRWLLVPVPSREEQGAIAEILDVADVAIERTREAITRAQQLRRSLLIDLLSLGIDENGRIRDPRRFPDQFVRTPVGLIPRDWRLSTVGMEFDLQTGFTINATRRPRFRKRPYLRVANVQRDEIRLDDVLELEASDFELEPRLLETDDLLVVEGHADRMQIGRCARVLQGAKGLTFQNHLFRLRTKGIVLPQFGCLWLNSTHAQKYWNARCATSSGLNTINQRTLKRLAIPAPARVEQEMISGAAEKQSEHFQALMKKLQRLVSLKASIALDLLSGRVCPKQTSLRKVA
jgi:type I restriction enzyme S subunit